MYKKNMYEIFDEFARAETKEQKRKVLIDNSSTTLVTVLQLVFHPNFQWKVKEKPAAYIKPNTVPGVAHANMESALHRLYLFQQGHPTAEKLTPKKQQELLLVLLESLEPREADVVIGIFKKDLGIKGLTYKFVKDIFPNSLP
jgi:hypothetical protein